MPNDTTQHVGAWPGYADGSTDATPCEAQQHPDMAVLIDRLNTALEERDHWRQEARREHALVEKADAALKQSRSEVAWAIAATEKMRRARDAARAMNANQVDLIHEARDVARQLYAHNRELARDMIAQRDEARATCTELAEERNAARGEIDQSAGVYTDYAPCPHCGWALVNGVCPHGCYPRDYSEEP